MLIPSPFGTASNFPCPVCTFEGAVGYGPWCDCGEDTCVRACLTMGESDSPAPGYHAAIAEIHDEAGMLAGVVLHCLHCEHTWRERFMEDSYD